LRKDPSWQCMKVLTGDSPEARAHGHEYPRLAESLASHGAAPLDQLIGAADNLDAGASPAAPGYFTGVEQDLIARVLSDYDGLTSVQMATLTRGPGSPWEQIYADGKGMNRKIPDDLMRAQFITLTEAVSSGSSEVSGD